VANPLGAGDQSSFPDGKQAAKQAAPSGVPVLWNRGRGGLGAKAEAEAKEKAKAKAKEKAKARQRKRHSSNPLRRSSGELVTISLRIKNLRWI
jgi:surface antigen